MKPIVFFDLETTGTSVVNDKIVSIALILITPNGSETHTSFLVNPGIPIPKEASDVHGITDDMVNEKPMFADIANGIFDIFKGADVGGFNSNSFDVPLLAEEFARCGLDFMSEKRRFFDAFMIFRKKERRDLTAAYQRYCGKELEGAHDAMVDIKATLEVFRAQMKEYPELKDLDTLHEFCEFGDRADFTGHLVYDNGVLTYNFGKHKGKPVKQESSYAVWMLNQDFSSVTKNLLKKELNIK